MQDDEYIKGLVLSSDIGKMYRHIVEPIKPQITIKGLEYLESNSFMAKAREALKLAGEIVSYSPIIYTSKFCAIWY